MIIIFVILKYIVTETQFDILISIVLSDRSNIWTILLIRKCKNRKRTTQWHKKMNYADFPTVSMMIYLSYLAHPKLFPEI